MKYLILLFSAFSFAQQTKFVDFKSVLGKIEINALDKSVAGEVTYNFEIINSIYRGNSGNCRFGHCE